MPDFYEAAWIFLIYSFLGWCTEVMFQAVIRGKFINRGFLNGPVCPVYGFGVLIVVICLTPIQDSLPALFFGSVVLTSALEFITGFALEKFFRDKWWDYSNEPFNIKGYICLRFSLAWGLACVFVMDVVHPLILAAVRNIPYTAGLITACVLLAGLLADAVISIAAAVKMRTRLIKMEELGEKLHGFSDLIGSSLAGNAIGVKKKLETGKAKLETGKESFDELLEKYRGLVSRRSRSQERLLRSFPNLRNGRYRHSIERFDLIWRMQKSHAARRRTGRLSAYREDREPISLLGYRSVLSAVVAAGEAGVPGFMGSAEAVAEITSRFCSVLEAAPAFAAAVETAAALHDIGLVAVSPDEVSSPALRAEKGAELLLKAGCPDSVGNIVRHLSENWDGSGGPKGLAGADIPLGSRIVRLCQAAEALLAGRGVAPLSPEDCKTELSRQSGSLFDPELTALLIENWDCVVRPVSEAGNAASAKAEI